MTDKQTQCQRIIAALKRARSRGCGSLRLSAYALRYGSRLHDLRKDGWKIETRRMSDDSFRYFLAAQDW